MSEWISVEDRLPEEYVTVLGYYDIYGRAISLWTGINWSSSDLIGTLPPTYWMPLPPGPEE